jgi:hypothetical protein
VVPRSPWITLLPPPPQLEAAIFQPGIQRGKVGEVRHTLQHLVAGIATVLLDLPPRRSNWPKDCRAWQT